MRYIKYVVLGITLLVGATLAACTSGSSNEAPANAVNNCVEVQQEWKENHPKPVEPQQPADVSNWEWLEHPDHVGYLHSIEGWISEQTTVFVDCLEEK